MSSRCEKHLSANRITEMSGERFLCWQFFVPHRQVSVSPCRGGKKVPLARRHFFLPSTEWDSLHRVPPAARVAIPPSLPGGEAEAERSSVAWPVAGRVRLQAGGFWRRSCAPPALPPPAEPVALPDCTLLTSPGPAHLLLQPIHTPGSQTVVTTHL